MSTVSVDQGIYNKRYKVKLKDWWSASWATMTPEMRWVWLGAVMQFARRKANVPEEAWWRCEDGIIIGDFYLIAEWLDVSEPQS